MTSSNPFESPRRPEEPSGTTHRLSRMVGTGILILGLLVLAYGAVAFWLINSLPPNGGAQGRLPSLYVMGGGIVGVLIGLAMRVQRSERGSSAAPRGAGGHIPTRYGIALLVGIVIVFILVVAQL